MTRYKGPFTTNYWTNPNDETYSITIFHYIENWEIKSLVDDFKVHHGTTSGEAIFSYQKEVLKGLDDPKSFFLIIIADTTGSIGTIGKYIREAGQEHAYCIDHNLHRNYLLAFLG